MFCSSFVPWEMFCIISWLYNFVAWETKTCHKSHKRLYSTHFLIVHFFILISWVNSLLDEGVHGEC